LTAFLPGERFHHGEGLLYDTDARIKLLIVVAFAFAATAIPEGHWRAFAAFTLFVAVAIAVSRLPLWLVLRRSLLALPFVLAAVPLIFTRSGETVATLPVLGWTISDSGLIAVASILLKSWLAVLMAVVLTSTTRPLDLIRALERLHVPRILASTVFFMYRYLFVIGAEGQRMMRARESRSALMPGVSGGGTIAWRARVLGTMVGTLFIHSFSRSERIYAAMLARGYDGTVRFMEESSLSRTDRIFGAIACVALGGLVLVARL
jgi:cobalt/nickel transport system permease protein